MTGRSELLDIIRATDFAKTELQGSPDFQCENWTYALHTELMGLGIQTVPVVSKPEHPKHAHLLVEVDEGVLIIDPSIAQFVPSMQGEVFLGTREELRDGFTRAEPGQLADMLSIYSDRSAAFLDLWGERSCIYPTPANHEVDLSRLDMDRFAGELQMENGQYLISSKSSMAEISAEDFMAALGLDGDGVTVNDLALGSEVLGLDAQQMWR